MFMYPHFSTSGQSIQDVKPIQSELSSVGNLAASRVDENMAKVSDVSYTPLLLLIRPHDARIRHVISVEITITRIFHKRVL